MIREVLFAPSQIAAIADADARENWEVMIGWRDHLVKHGTLEAAYLDIIRHKIRFPQLLVGQLTQVILRNALDDCDDVFVLRAAEMFFRPQKLAMQEGLVTVIDAETEALLVGSPGRRWLRCWDCRSPTRSTCSTMQRQPAIGNAATASIWHSI